MLQSWLKLIQSCLNFFSNLTEYVMYCFLARAFWQNVIIFFRVKIKAKTLGSSREVVGKRVLQSLGINQLKESERLKHISKCATKKSAREPLWFHLHEPRVRGTRRFSFCSRLISCSQVSTAPFSDNNTLYSNIDLLQDQFDTIK